MDASCEKNCYQKERRAVPCHDEKVDDPLFSVRALAEFSLREEVDYQLPGLPDVDFEGHSESQIAHHKLEAPVRVAQQEKGENGCHDKVCYLNRWRRPNRVEKSVLHVRIACPEKD